MSNTVCVVIPAYNRHQEMQELLISILQQSVLPEKVLICEDKSPERLKIRALYQKFQHLFKEVNCELKLVENEANLGYDANLRQCIEICEADWAFIMGNDDVILKNGIEIFKEYVSLNKVDMVGRSFLRFYNDIDHPIGISSLSRDNIVFKQIFHGSKYIFKSCGFVGGLSVNVKFAKKLSTTIFDGGLFYQIYLGAHAFCDNGIGYISTPIVGGRAGNPPLFGSSDNESEIYVPGSYTAKGRCNMWKSIIDIAIHVGDIYGVDLLTDLKRELNSRQVFHVFEMNVGVGNEELKLLKTGLKDLGLFDGVIPYVLYYMNKYLGRNAGYFYSLVRKILQ